MTSVLKEIIQYAFINFELNILYAHVFSFNPGSARILIKNGFTVDYVIPNGLIKDGVLYDDIVYSIRK